MLCRAGVEGARDSSWDQLRPASAAQAAKAWEVFTRFAEEPVEGVDPEGGDVGASYGTYDWHDGRGESYQLSLAVGEGEEGRRDRRSHTHDPEPEVALLDGFAAMPISARR